MPTNQELADKLEDLQRQCRCRSIQQTWIQPLNRITSKFFKKQSDESEMTPYAALEQFREAVRKEIAKDKRIAFTRLNLHALSTMPATP
jgi:hypothetical protein